MDKDAKTAQGHEMNIGVNCLGTFLFTKLLTHALVSTAKSEPQSSVSVVWVSSAAGLKDTGLPLAILEDHHDYQPLFNYGYSKAGDYLYGVEYAEMYKDDGVISVPVNPSNLWSMEKPKVEGSECGSLS